ncbi:hypothetical protein [Streptomyces lydicus]|uniref:hypothetical protein n=1 Tax=Streptomyces lydicus TaxID=47763 RepID=UPI0036EB1CC8
MHRLVVAAGDQDIELAIVPPPARDLGVEGLQFGRDLPGVAGVHDHEQATFST